MAVWKQALVVLLVLVIAGFAWLRFFPGAPAVLAGWGVDLPAAILPEAEPAAATRPAQGGNRQQGAVVAAAVRPATINDRLSAIGTGRANASVSIRPYSTGRLAEIVVGPGARVASGDVLATLDSDVEEIAVDRARIAMEDAVARAGRVKSLLASNAATTVQVTDADLAVQTLRLALRDAELALERRAIVSPISGIVGILPVEAGNFVNPETEIARIEDRSSIIVDFYVPERYANAIEIDAPVSASSIARPKDVLQGKVSQIDNRLDDKSRTLLVRARIANTDDSLRAGMSFQVSMRFAGDTYPSVSPLAIQWGTDGAFVWAVRDGVAKRTPVRIVQRNTENVLVEAALAADEQVVTEGIHLVRDNAPVRLAGDPTTDAGRAENRPMAAGDGS